MKTITTKQYILTEEEINTIEKVLKYARHRFKKHEGCGIYKTGVKPTEVHDLLDSIDKAKSRKEGTLEIVKWVME